MFGKEFEQLPFNKWQILQEIKIRGRCIAASADLEFLLVKIIVYCDTKNPIITRKFKRIKFDQKIKWAKQDLKRHHPTIYKSLEKYLNQIYKLKKLRNDLAHNKIDFDPNESDKSFILVREITFKDGENKLQTTTYTMKELDDALKEFREVIWEMVKTWDYLVKDYTQSNS